MSLLLPLGLILGLVLGSLLTTAVAASSETTGAMGNLFTDSNSIFILALGDWGKLSVSPSPYVSSCYLWILIIHA